MIFLCRHFKNVSSVIQGLILFFLWSSAHATMEGRCESNTLFNIGAGIYDITGPAAEEGMMGYGMLKQRTSGIYQRLWARAFVIESPCNQKRIVFVNADLGNLFQGIKQQVIKKLQKKYGDRYSDQNVLLTAIHTHSGPGGYSTYLFYNITTLGFNHSHFDTIVDGIVAAIERAQTNMTPAHIRYAAGKLPGITYNRSPEAYLLNPAEERSRYAGDKDIEMTLLRFDSVDGKPIGMINWFPIHGVSMNNKNFLINGDNKGYAEYLFEKDMQSDYGANAFVAAFAQAHAGDVSPNQYGHEGGTGLEGIKAVEQAGKPQYEMAKQLYKNASEIVSGGVDYRHTFVDMGHLEVKPDYTDGKMYRTCPGAIGVSMLAGSQDGEGVGWQGVTCDTLHQAIPYYMCEEFTTSCQGIKPIAVPTGSMEPYPWTPQILPMQVIKIGQMVVGAVPMELTTMTGRRLQYSIASQLPVAPKHHVVLSTLANAYAGYVATNEEYQLQRYEGASTHFGPWTAAALQQIFTQLSKALASGEAVEAGPTPPEDGGTHINLQTGVVYDSVPSHKQFGDLYEDVKPHYQPGETAQAVFWGAHPKNNYRIQDTFLEVQRLENGKWVTVRRDQDWDTEYHWQRNGLANSLVTIVWRIPADITPGQYRIVHHGDWKALFTRKITPYTGYSSPFIIGSM